MSQTYVETPGGRIKRSGNRHGGDHHSRLRYPVDSKVALERIRIFRGPREVIIGDPNAGRIIVGVFAPVKPMVATAPAAPVQPVVAAPPEYYYPSPVSTKHASYNDGPKSHSWALAQIDAMKS